MYFLQINTSIMLFYLVTKGTPRVHYMYFTLYISLTLGRRGRMVVRFTATYAISAYQFESRLGEVYSMQHYTGYDNVCQ